MATTQIPVDLDILDPAVKADPYPAYEALRARGRTVMLAGVDGLAERQWPGHRLRLGEAIIEVAQVRGRCVMTTYDPDTQEQDLNILRRLVEEFDGRMALDCAVIQSGRLTVGAPVELL